MTAHLPSIGTAAEALAYEATRYLEAVDAFASVGADPDAAVRARAAHARRSENQSAHTTGKGVWRWPR